MKSFFAAILFKLGEKIWAAIMDYLERQRKKKALRAEIKKIIKEEPDAQKRAARIDALLNR